LPPEMVKYVGKSVATRKDLREWRSTYTELDEDLGGDIIPFRGVVWVFNTWYLWKHCTRDRPYIDSINHLWGNQSNFSIYWYKDVALFVKIGDEEEKIVKKTRKRKWKKGRKEKMI